MTRPQDMSDEQLNAAVEEAIARHKAEVQAKRELRKDKFVYKVVDKPRLAVKGGLTKLNDKRRENKVERKKRIHDMQILEAEQKRRREAEKAREKAIKEAEAQAKEEGEFPV